MPTTGPRLNRDQLLAYLRNHNAVLYKKEKSGGIAWYRTDSGMFVRVRALITGDYEVQVHRTCGCQ